MKTMKTLPFALLLILFSCEEIPVIEDEDPLDDPTEIVLENRTKAGILTYFGKLIENDKVIAGQHCGDGPDQVDDYYQTYVETLNNQTGKYVGLIGADFGWYISETYPVDKLVEFWNDGGLVTVSWHADNPFTEGIDVRINSVENRELIDFKALLKDAPESEAKSDYRTELDLIAKALQKLKDAGVIVLWRPLHEMNGDFFWWGIDAYNTGSQTNISDFTQLWKDMYETLEDDYGLDNLIWVYSAVPTLSWNATSIAYYPGDEVVDLVGLDYYGVDPAFPDFESLKALGKTIVMSESGPLADGYGKWDLEEHVSKLKGKAAYFLQWHSWNDAEVAIMDNLNAKEMMTSKEVITRDEIN